MYQGYQSKAYVESFREWGDARKLPACGGWLLERTTPFSPYRDLMGCYPVFSCQDWSALREDLSELPVGLVSLTLVTDPFGQFEAKDLEFAFDRVRAYKQHFVTDLREFPPAITHRKTLKNLRKSMKYLDIELCPNPFEWLDEWNELYAGLCNRHRVTGLLAFTPRILEGMLGTPGLVMFRASLNGRTVGLHTWMEQGEVAYGHLGATTEEGYEHMAAYALYWSAIEYFRQRVRWLGLGGGAGDNQSTGLSEFKQRWATGTRPVYLCTNILDHKRYNQLAELSGTVRSEYFPAYRTGEFKS